jgi:Tfp pilus assembly protein PilN
MKAVNLIPAEDRRGAGGAAGRSGGAVYIVLALLALLVAGVAANTLVGRSVDDRKAELAVLQKEVATQQARTAELQSFAAFRALSQARIETVRSLATSRFDWGAALNEVARVTPKRTWLTSMSATVAPGVAVAGGGAGGLRSALGVPAIEISGCTTSQKGVARTLTAMRRIEGVKRVSLSSAEKADAGSGGGGAGGDCRQGDSRFPQFQMVVFFEPPAGAILPTAGAVPGAATPASTAGSTPDPAAADPAAANPAADPAATTPAAGTEGTQTAPAQDTTVGKVTDGQAAKGAVLDAAEEDSE